MADRHDFTPKQYQRFFALMTGFYLVVLVLLVVMGEEPVGILDFVPLGLCIFGTLSVFATQWFQAYRNKKRLKRRQRYLQEVIMPLCDKITQGK